MPLLVDENGQSYFFDEALNVIPFTDELGNFTASSTGTASTTALVSTPDPSVFGQLVTFQATVTGGATGVVNFQDGLATIGSVTLVAGVATLTYSGLAIGTHSITAVYGGDTTFAPSTSNTVSQIVNSGVFNVVPRGALRLHR